MAVVNEKRSRPKATAVRVHWGTKWRLHRLKVHPKESEEMVIKRLIKFYEENAKAVQRLEGGEGVSGGEPVG